MFDVLIAAGDIWRGEPPSYRSMAIGLRDRRRRSLFSSIAPSLRSRSAAAPYFF